MNALPVLAPQPSGPNAELHNRLAKQADPSRRSYARAAGPREDPRVQAAGAEMKRSCCDAASRSWLMLTLQPYPTAASRERPLVAGGLNRPPITPPDSGPSRKISADRSGSAPLSAIHIATAAGNCAAVDCSATASCRNAASSASSRWSCPRLLRTDSAAPTSRADRRRAIGAC